MPELGVCLGGETLLTEGGGGCSDTPALHLKFSRHAPSEDQSRILKHPRNPLVRGFWGDIQYVNAQDHILPTGTNSVTVPLVKVPPVAQVSFISHFNEHSCQGSVGVLETFTLKKKK